MQCPQWDSQRDCGSRQGPRCAWRDGLAQAAGALPEPWWEFCMSLRAGRQHQVCMGGIYWSTYVENGLSGETGFREAS